LCDNVDLLLGRIGVFGITPILPGRNFQTDSYAQVYAALAYYHANREEIEAALAEDEAAGDRAETEWYRSRFVAIQEICRWHSINPS
jgi:hypothetical protein